MFLGKTLPLIARVFSDRTLRIVGPFYLLSVPGGSKRPHSGYIKVTCSGLADSSISWWLWASCAHHRLRSAVLHDTDIGAAARLRGMILYEECRVHTVLGRRVIQAETELCTVILHSVLC